MTSITAQQTKLDLELVPKENRLDIRKCNGRIPRGLKPKEKTFKVALDALALSPFYPAFVITADVPEVYMHLIKDQDLDALPSEEDTISFLKELGHTGVVNTLNDESKAYKTYHGYATGTVPPKVARKFKKAYPSKKDSVAVPADEEPVQKGKRVKRSAKKSSTTPTTDERSYKKSLRDFHKSHPSGSGSVTEKPQSIEKITPPVTNKGNGDKPGVPDVTKDDSTESESESWGNDDDDSNDEEGSEQENDSEEHESDSEQDTDESESDSKSNQQDDNDDEVKDDDEDDDNDDDQFEGDEERRIDSDEVPDKKADVGMTDA
uniref:Uncharacterized protein n=1 Tax=Tanacetum cinerariifolium TaxID=118510 RepID=A0A699I2T8_TANCI|nr:hypothetical protein [Tanacetum cinerariifolium]